MMEVAFQTRHSFIQPFNKYLLCAYCKTPPVALEQSFYDHRVCAPLREMNNKKYVQVVLGDASERGNGGWEAEDEEGMTF